MVLKIPINGAGLMVIHELMGRVDLRLRFASGIGSIIPIYFTCI